MPMLVPVVRDAAREHDDAGFRPSFQAITVTYKMLTVPDSGRDRNAATGGHKPPGHPHGPAGFDFAP
jgi:hypothetical protein